MKRLRSALAALLAVALVFAALVLPAPAQAYVLPVYDFAIHMQQNGWISQEIVYWIQELLRWYQYAQQWVQVANKLYRNELGYNWYIETLLALVDPTLLSYQSYVENFEPTWETLFARNWWEQLDEYAYPYVLPGGETIASFAELRHKRTETLQETVKGIAYANRRGGDDAKTLQDDLAELNDKSKTTDSEAAEAELSNMYLSLLSRYDAHLHQGMMQLVNLDVLEDAHDLRLERQRADTLDVLFNRPWYEPGGATLDYNQLLD